MSSKDCSVCHSYPADVRVAEDRSLCLPCWDREMEEAHWREYNADKGWDED
jgi:hypothetical protein